MQPKNFKEELKANIKVVSSLEFIILIFKIFLSCCWTIPVISDLTSNETQNEDEACQSWLAQKVVDRNISGLEIKAYLNPGTKIQCAAA